VEEWVFRDVIWISRRMQPAFNYLVKKGINQYFNKTIKKWTVHHHSHTERKKWTILLWEFLMLFLAVTLGFLVET
jgi:hypothetical protein